MEARTKVNITELVDNSKLGGFQWNIFILCSLCLIMDGFDVQSMGYVAPVLVQDLNVPAAALGGVFSAGLFGVLVGSLLFSVLSDKLGRRPMLIFGSLYFAVLTIITAQAQTVTQLLLIRFIAGIGLGGMMPNAMALVGEYSPAKIRVRVMMIVSCGFTAGAAVGGFIAAWLIPLYGWRGVFYFGGAIPLVIAGCMILWLPESLQFLVLNGKSPDTIRKWLSRVEPDAPMGDHIEFVVKEQAQAGVPAVHLFREGRTKVTLLLWVVQFMNLLNLYFLSSWVPTVVRTAGYSTFIAVMVGTTTQIGGTIGSFGNSWFIGKFGFVRALSGSFLVACLSIAMIGQPYLSLVALFAVVFVAGWGIIGGQPGVNALAAVYYPTNLRSTGIGWSLGIGRIGAIVGPYIGGELLRMQWMPRDVFLAAALPALVSSVVVLGLRSSMRENTQSQTAMPAPVH